MSVHLLALAPAGVGVCCLAADRRRPRGAELATGVLMLVAMADAAGPALMPAVGWAVLLIAASLALVATHGRARGRRAVARAGEPGERAMVVHAAVGMIVMAALMLAMSVGSPAGAGAAAAGVAGGGSSLGPSAGPHAHGGSSVAVLVVLGAVYAVASLVLAVRTRGALGRVQYAAMAASVGLMSAAMVV